MIAETIVSVLVATMVILAEEKMKANLASERTLPFGFSHLFLRLQSYAGISLVEEIRSLSCINSGQKRIRGVRFEST
jgi:hypothetical protein